MLKDEIKQFIKKQCGDPAIGFCDVSDLTLKDVDNLRKTNAIMGKYSAIFDPETPVFQPKDFLDNAKSIIVIGGNGCFERPELPGNPPRGLFMNFFVNQDYLNYAAGLSEKITTFLSEKGYQGIAVPNGIPLKIMAARSGMGTYGKNGIIQAPGRGSLLSLNVIVTDAELEADQPLEDTCGKCTKCQEACPTHALDTPYSCDIEKCITLHTIYNQTEIPGEIQDNTGTSIAQCCICLDVCPKNNKLTIQTDVNVPQDIVYPEIAPLVNMTDEFFQDRYGGSFLEFVMTDKKYLQRNATIALGNYGDPAYIPVLQQALETQTEEVVLTAASRSLEKLKAIKGH
jgi:epoxyqueuosine reductase